MAGKLNFSLVAPEREVYSGLVPEHAPFMTALREGEVTVIDGSTRRRFAVKGGFADVTPQGLTILAEEATELAAA